MKFTELWFSIKTIGLIVLAALAAIAFAFFACYFIVSGIKNARKYKMLEKHGFKEYLHAPRNGYREAIYGMKNGCESILNNQISVRSYKDLEQWAIKAEQEKREWDERIAEMEAEHD